MKLDLMYLQIYDIFLIERYQLNKRNNIKGLPNLYNDYVVSFDAGAICLLKHCQKCKEVKGENQGENV